MSYIAAMGGQQVSGKLRAPIEVFYFMKNADAIWRGANSRNSNMYGGSVLG